MEHSKEMAKIAYRALEDKKGENIKIIDIEGISVLADYFLIASGSNESQIRAMVDNVEEELEKAVAEGKEIVIRVTGRGFLYNMVRIIAGTLMKVGMGVYPPEHVEEILAAKDRRRAGQTAPAVGLTLVGMEYETELSQWQHSQNADWEYHILQSHIKTDETAYFLIRRCCKEDWERLICRNIHPVPLFMLDAVPNQIIVVVNFTIMNKFHHFSQYAISRTHRQFKVLFNICATMTFNIFTLVLIFFWIIQMNQISNHAFRVLHSLRNWCIYQIRNFLNLLIRLLSVKEQ